MHGVGGGPHCSAESTSSDLNLLLVVAPRDGGQGSHLLRHLSICPPGAGSLHTVNLAAQKSSGKTPRKGWSITLRGSVCLSPGPGVRLLGRVDKGVPHLERWHLALPLAGEVLPRWLQSHRSLQCPAFLLWVPPTQAHLLPCLVQGAVGRRFPDGLQGPPCLQRRSAGCSSRSP